MANYFSLTLDTTAPAAASISLAGGASYATSQIVAATIGTSDTPTTGYQIKIYGDVDPTYDANIKVAVGDSVWFAYTTSVNVKLSATDGSKTVKLLIRDDVYNACSETTDSITLDTTLPTGTITGPDVNKISKVTGKETCSFSFQVDVVFDEYKVKVVPATNSINTAGAAIATAHGSTNMAGSAGSYPATTDINSTIKGEDLQDADAGDGSKYIKVFVKDVAGNWSV